MAPVNLWKFKNIDAAFSGYNVAYILVCIACRCNHCACRYHGIFDCHSAAPIILKNKFLCFVGYRVSANFLTSCLINALAIVIMLLMTIWFKGLLF